MQTLVDMVLGILTQIFVVFVFPGILFVFVLALLWE